MLEMRRSFHLKWLWISACGIPFSLLFAVVPGPNIPLFWNVFRLYSNWSAWKASEYLLSSKSKIKYVQYPENVLNEQDEIEFSKLMELKHKYGWDGEDKELRDFVELGQKQYLRMIKDNKAI